MSLCPCGTSIEYDQCCGPFHRGDTSPLTAESLMRSRYSAYVKCEIPYLTHTLLPEQRPTFSQKAAKEWAQGAQWLGLEIVKARGGESDQNGEVEFIAKYKQGEEELEHHEISTFKKRAGKWYFADGRLVPKIVEGSVISRNAPCPCGSGKKYKKCCA